MKAIATEGRDDPMILAFCTKTADGRDLDDRFGRAAAFLILDSAGGRDEESLANPMVDASGSAGIGAVQLLVDKGVEGLVAPHLGPKAADAASRLDLKVWDQGESSTVDEALEAWTAGKLEVVSEKGRPQGLYRA
jgi:predicted Fe-Mo cluster-binding NifX family protein